MAGSRVPRPSPQSGKPAAPFHLHVVGWRRVAHSIALVNQWQLLALKARRDVRLTTTDAALLEGWSPSEGMFGPAQAKVLASIPGLSPGDPVDAEYRIFTPCDLGNPADLKRRVLAFTVTEYKGAPIRIVGADSLAAVNDRENFSLVVPSNWVRDCLVVLGVRAERIEVVPHGAATVFRPNALSRAQLRQRLNLDRFTFLTVGLMTYNKGMSPLLKAFGRLLDRGIPARLILKGSDALYPAKTWLGEALSDLDPRVRGMVLDNLTYLGNTLGMEDMAALYNAADAYVSPYLAEGFNLPVLEAAATGLPIVCTRGGSTDDFTTDDFRRGIESRVVTEDDVTFLDPSEEHLLELMSAMVSDKAFQQRAKQYGPRFVDQGFRWERVVDKLMTVVRDQ